MLVVVATFVAVTCAALAALVIVYRQELRSGRVVLLGGVKWHPSDADIQQVIDATPDGLRDPDASSQLIRD